MDILDTFSVGELRVVFQVVLLLLGRRKGRDELDRHCLLRWLEGGNVLAGGSTAERRPSWVHVVSCLPTNRTFVVD